MTEPMTLDRFRTLADAYGGVTAHWPDDQQDAATRIASQPAAIAILAHASALDTVMDAWTMPAPTRSLAEQIAGHAPTSPRSVTARARLWWSGIGIAAAFVGAVSGTAVVIAVVPPIEAAPDSGTSFGAVDAQDGGS